MSCVNRGQPNQRTPETGTLRETIGLWRLRFLYVWIFFRFFFIFLRWWQRKVQGHGGSPGRTKVEREIWDLKPWVTLFEKYRTWNPQNSPKTPLKVLGLLFFGPQKKYLMIYSNFLMCKGFGRSEYRIFKTNPSQIQILACDWVQLQCCRRIQGNMHEQSDTPP